MKLGKTYFSGSLTFDEGNNRIGPNSSVLTGSLSGSVKGTFEGSFVGNTLTNISGAFDSVSSSLASRVASQESFSSSLDATFATDAQVATAVSSLNAATSSYLLKTTDTLDGNLTVTGTITAQEFHTEYVSASIIYESGSTQFGNSSDDTHIFSGSALVSGSIGIGTSSPDNGLHVKDTNIHLQASNAKIKLSDFENSMYLRMNNTGSLEITDSNEVTLVHFNKEGRVGIGTNSPAELLHLFSVSNSGPEIRFQHPSGSHYIRAYDNNWNFLADTSVQAISIQNNGTTTFGANVLLGNTVVNPATGFADQSGIGLKESSTVPKIEVSSDDTGLTVGRTTTGGAGVIADFRYESNVRHSFGTANSYMLGNVGIGETTPLGKLHVKGSDTGVTTPSAQGNLLVLEDSENGLSILSSTAGAGYINFGDSDDNDIGMIIYGHSSNSMDFWTNANKRMTIDSSGNITILNATATNSKTIGITNAAGTTGWTFGNGVTANVHQFVIYDNTEGSARILIDSNGRVIIGGTSAYQANSTTITDSGFIGLRRTSASVLELRRDSTGGGLLTFQQDGNDNGVIGVVDNNSVYIGNFQTNDVGLRFIGVTNDIRPCTSAGANRDNAVDLGDANARFKDMYLANSLLINSGTSYNDKGYIYLSNQRTAIISDIVNLTANGDTSLDFQTRSGGSTASAMFIDEFRNVGINASASLRFNGAGDNTHAIGYDSVIDGSFLRGQLGMRFLTGTGGGSERMRITSGGNVVIGGGSEYTGTGVTSLAINNDSYPTLSLGSTSGTRMALLAYSTYNYLSSSNPFYFDTGKVGIGTTSASSVLQVHGQQKWYTTNADGNELRGFFNPGGSGDPANFRLYDADGASVWIDLYGDGKIYSKGLVTNYGTGTGTYTRTTYYHDTSNGLLFEGGRTTDSSTGTGITWKFTWRGGAGTGGGVQLVHGDSAWTALSSDERLKTKTADVENGLDAITALTPIKYKWNNDIGSESEREITGFTAQNVQTAIPDAVFTSSQDEELGNILTYRESYITAYLVKAVQELKAENDTLRAEINAIKNA